MLVGFGSASIGLTIEKKNSNSQEKTLSGYSEIHELHKGFY
jgi:hypothetical protein